ncbi:LURP-one-related/scramblase family protein [Halomicroarcula sp. GCM10025709]|uniref:LURP-one-related/scramblase family protein n=1 Tax=Haloarcula TaxID=2237 RepID=UPI0024C425A0|nr:hypothetical protein [Halomicroarcula sp. YJ-61-S]
MSTTGTYDIKGLDLTDDSYTVEQSLVRNKYKAMDQTGSVVLRGKQKMFKAKESFPFVDENDTDVFEVNAGSMLDVAGNYTLTDSQTGEDLVVLDNDFSILQDTWRIRDAGTEEMLAQIDSQGAAVTLARNFLPFGQWIPHKYEITDSDGGHVGNIDGQFSMKDRYDITIDDASSVPKEVIIAAAMVIDAIQGN